MKTWSWRRGRPGGPWPWESFVDFFWLKTWRQPADRHHLCMWHSAGSHQDQVLLCPFLFWPSKSRSVQSEVWRVYDCTLVLHGKLRQWTLRKKSKSKASHSRLQDTKWMEWKKQSISFLTHRGVAKFPDIALTNLRSVRSRWSVDAEPFFFVAESIWVWVKNAATPFNDGWSSWSSCSHYFPVINPDFHWKLVGDSRRHCVATFEVCSMRRFCGARPGLSILSGLLEDATSKHGILHLCIHTYICIIHIYIYTHAYM